ncbi:MerR family DNA-binding protein [Microbispora amethystogenes]|uniref:MerR family DNA-binding protein n=1 Tax=Microbispora amethystogenes TaxID=1427754 RepID=UPI0033F7CC3F
MTGGAASGGRPARAVDLGQRPHLLGDPQPIPSNGGHRLYPPQTVTVLRVIKAAQRLGFTLDEVADLVETAAHRHGRRDSGLRAKATAKLAEVERKIPTLT